MENRLTELSYEDWLEHVFSHEIRKYQAAWYFDLDAPWWDGPPAVTVAYLTRLFEDPDPALAYFADSQIAQGLHYLIDSGAGGYVVALSQSAVALQERLRCLESIGTLFAHLFAPRCTPHLSHLDEPGASPLNVTCYMWWDIFPVGGPAGDPDGGAMDQAILSVMEGMLDLPSPACQESALHGLGHWQTRHSDQVGAIVDRFLSQHTGLRPELAAYARGARTGCVL
jgi:hypothetical protein